MNTGQEERRGERGGVFVCAGRGQKEKREGTKLKAGQGRHGGRDVCMCFVWDLFLIGPPWCFLSCVC